MACVRACAYNPVTQIRYIFLLFSPKILGEGLDGPIEKAELGKGGDRAIEQKQYRINIHVLYIERSLRTYKLE